jgi:hypothetical protein
VQDVTDIDKYKSFKIVPKDGGFKNGDKLEFSMDVITSVNIGYNGKSYLCYTTYYELDNQKFSNDCIVGLRTEEKEYGYDDTTNQEEVAQLTVGSIVSQSGTVLSESDSVYEREILRYTVIVKNTSGKTINNIKIKANAENSNMYYLKKWIVENYQNLGDYLTSKYMEDTEGEHLYEEFTVDTLAPGESYSFEYQAIVLKGATEVFGNIIVSADEIEETVTHTMVLKVEPAKLEIRTGYGPTEDIGQNDTLAGGQFTIYTYVKNLTDTDLTNIKLSIMIPSELYYNEIYPTLGAEGLSMSLDETTTGQTLTFIIPKLSAGADREIDVQTFIREFDKDVDSTYTTIKSTVIVDDEQYNSNDYTKILKQSKTKVSYSWTADTVKDTLEDGDIVVLTFSVKNTGAISCGLSMQTEICSGFEFVSAVITDENSTEPYNTAKNNGVLSGGLTLSSGETGTFEITYKVNKELFEIDQQKLEAKLNVYSSEVEDFSTNVISFKIQNTNVTYDSPNNDGQEDDRNLNNTTNNTFTGNVSNSTENSASGSTGNEVSEVTQDSITYRISGQVWQDTNKDGIKENESGKSAIVVMLYGTTSEGGIDTSNEVDKTVTNTNGEYVFTGVKNGNYVVVFSYDTSIYNITKYQVSTATVDKNSDAISKNVYLNGSNSVYALTDMLTINNASLINIDLGLITINTFDLSLDKYISNIKVTNKKGTNIYEFEGCDATNEKIEVSSKYYKNTTLDITYKIVVSNEGDVVGYVNKIVDYLPDGMTFDTEKNTDWYYGDDGNIYYSGFIGKAIEAGDSISVNLTLSKTLASGEALKIVNGAEIVTSTNSLGFVDIDSVENNKIKTEDDYGEAIITVSISTGAMQGEIGLMIIVIALITISSIVIYNNKKNTKKVYR